MSLTTQLLQGTEYVREPCWSTYRLPFSRRRYARCWANVRRRCPGFLHSICGQYTANRGPLEHPLAGDVDRTTPAFNPLYEGENSLPPHPESRVSLTATVLLGFRVNQRVELIVNPELAWRQRFWNADGIAGFTNDEIPRVSSATPTIYAARALVRTVWVLGPETEFIENGLNKSLRAYRASALRPSPASSP
jgi:hypothetical protein